MCAEDKKNTLRFNLVFSNKKVDEVRAAKFLSAQPTRQKSAYLTKAILAYESAGKKNAPDVEEITKMAVKVVLDVLLFGTDAEFASASSVTNIGVSAPKKRGRRPKAHMAQDVSPKKQEHPKKEVHSGANTQSPTTEDFVTYEGQEGGMNNATANDTIGNNSENAVSDKMLNVMDVFLGE